MLVIALVFMKHKEVSIKNLLSVPTLYFKTFCVSKARAFESQENTFL